MGNALLAYTAIRGTGGHIFVAAVPSVIGIWRLNQRRINANVTTSGSDRHMARLPILLDWDFDCETVWDTTKLTTTVWNTLSSSFASDDGILGPIEFHVGEAGGIYAADTFVLDLCTIINSSADAVRVRIQGSCNIEPLTFV